MTLQLTSNEWTAEVLSDGRVIVKAHPKDEWPDEYPNVRSAVRRLRAEASALKRWSGASKPEELDELADLLERDATERFALQ